MFMAVFVGLPPALVAAWRCIAGRRRQRPGLPEELQENEDRGIAAEVFSSTTRLFSKLQGPPLHIDFRRLVSKPPRARLVTFRRERQVEYI